jgi:hypothetical protein
MTGHIPYFDAIDYSRPEAYCQVNPSFAGDEKSIMRVSEGLRSANQEAILGAIWRWVRDNLPAEQKQTDYRWRTVSEILERGFYYGCAEHALVYGSLSRGCGIPTAWVKSLDVPWIRSFVLSGAFNGRSGHVYLQIFVSSNWCLLDATQDELFDCYSTRERLLSGRNVQRYAYDKGGGARELVLSLDWELWKKETRRFFNKFDLEELSRARSAVVGRGRRLAV